MPFINTDMCIMSLLSLTKTCDTALNWISQPTFITAQKMEKKKA